MSPPDLFLEAGRRDLRLAVRRNKVMVFPKGALAAHPDFFAVLLAHKAELLVWLTQLPCPGWGTIPPNDLPLDPVIPAPSAWDRERMLTYLVRQGCDRPGPLTRWLVRREVAYFNGPGRDWDCAPFAYAAARDAACWQTGRDERGVLDL